MKTLNTDKDSLREIWDEAGSLTSSPGYENDLAALHQAMGVNNSKRAHASRKWLYSLAVAASLALLMTAEYLYINNKKVAPAETISLITSSSSKGDFLLPDGSHVWLNSASKLSYDASNPRSVKLEGEGFFDVVKKDGLPFVVHSGNISVNVLGTKFNVRSSDHYQQQEVALVSGRVEIQAGDKALLLSPGEKATISADILEKRNADVTYDASWIENELVFENVSLADILTSLEHWYNVSIRVASPNVNLSSRLSFKLRKESLEETFRIVSRLTGRRFKALDEQNIIIL